MVTFRVDDKIVETWRLRSVVNPPRSATTVLLYTSAMHDMRCMRGSRPTSPFSLSMQSISPQISAVPQSSPSRAGRWAQQSSHQTPRYLAKTNLGDAQSTVFVAEQPMRQDKTRQLCASLYWSIYWVSKTVQADTAGRDYSTW